MSISELATESTPEVGEETVRLRRVHQSVIQLSKVSLKVFGMISKTTTIIVDI